MIAQWPFILGALAVIAGLAYAASQRMPDLSSREIAMSAWAFGRGNVGQPAGPEALRSPRGALRGGGCRRLRKARLPGRCAPRTPSSLVGAQSPPARRTPRRLSAPPPGSGGRSGGRLALKPRPPRPLFWLRGPAFASQHLNPSFVKIAVALRGGRSWP